MKSKSNHDIILAFTLMIAFFQQYGYSVQIMHSDHENTILSAQTFLNQQNIQLKTIAPYQHERKLKRYVQKFNAQFRSVLSSIKFKLPNKLYAQLFTAVQQMINNMSNSNHPTLTPSIIFKGTKIDLNIQNWSHSAHMPRYTMPNELTTSINLILIMASNYILLMIQHLI
jgi:hypothetical protein